MRISHPYSQLHAISSTSYYEHILPLYCRGYNEYSVIIKMDFLQVFTSCLETELRKKIIIRTDGSLVMNERHYEHFK